MIWRAGQERVQSHFGHLAAYGVCRVAFLALAVSHLHLHSSPIVSL